MNGENNDNGNIWLWLSLAACAALLSMRNRKQGKRVATSAKEVQIESYVEQSSAEHVADAKSAPKTTNNDEHSNEDFIFNPWYLGLRCSGMGHQA